MPPTVRIENRAGLADREFSRLSADLADQRTMGRAIDWLSSQSPPLSPDGMVTQDEFSFDILVPFGGSFYLAYDSN